MDTIGTVKVMFNAVSDRVDSKKICWDTIFTDLYDTIFTDMGMSQTSVPKISIDDGRPILWLLDKNTASIRNKLASQFVS